MKAQIERYTNHGMTYWPFSMATYSDPMLFSSITVRNERLKDGTEKQWYLLTYKQAKKRIRMLKGIDPTGEKQKYINWLIGLDINGTSGFPEDNFDIAILLNSFENLKKKKGWWALKDIYKYKTAAQLSRAIHEFRQRQTMSSYNDTWFNRYIACDWENPLADRPEKVEDIPKGAMEVYSGKSTRVIEILEARAASILLQNTPWCIRFPKIFKEKYTPPFYLFLKDDFPFMLCDETSQQLQDIHNGRISRDTWILVEPILDKLNLKFDFYAEGISIPQGISDTAASARQLTTNLAENAADTLNGLITKEMMRQE